MQRVVGCFIGNHDLGLVGLSAVICAVAAVTCIELLIYTRRAKWRIYNTWLYVAALAGGSGIWATHFVAMLAFEPSVPSGYELKLTALSLIYAVVITGGGLVISHKRELPHAPLLGGLILGFGISTTHYTGMAAYEIAGHLSWDVTLVIISLIIGLILGSASLQIALSTSNAQGTIFSTLLLIIAIVGHHFTVMGAITIVPDSAVRLSETALPSRWLAAGVALVSLTILFLACAALALDIRERRQAARERERLNSLANAAVEGLVVCRDDLIVTGNDSFGCLVGLEANALSGTMLSQFLPEASSHMVLHSQQEQPLETNLKSMNSGLIPVELIIRSITYGHRPHYAVAVRDLRPRRKAERRIHFLAHHDALTGLANRTSFAQRFELELKRAHAAGSKLAVLCLDLDRFKQVNDLFGHAAGDNMLVMFARSISALLDETQLMARLGGDEFAILMPCDHPMAAGHLAEQIIEALRIGGTDIAGPVVATSVGIALYPDDADERTVLLSYADTALYKAKSEGRGTFRFFEATLGAQIRERRMLEHDLRHAITRGEMHLVYQPQTNLQTGELIGFEVLLRWHHDERGAISPALFIPIAEESGVILQIGEWVLREACREAASWPNPLSIGVNVSAVQLHAPAFVQTVHEVLFQTGLKPPRLEIEVTETALIRDPSRAQSTLRQLKALGVRIAMDDFGTGYSSLSNLRTYPFDKIKIDSSFVRSIDTNEQTKAIVRSVISLGRGLGLPVIAEGVETTAELRFLADESCEAAQGYLLGRPAEIVSFMDYTHNSKSVFGAIHVA